MKGKLATYKYAGASSPRFAFDGLFNSPFGVVLSTAILGVIIYLCSQSNTPIPYFFGAMACMVFLYFFIAGKGPGIIVSSKYFVYDTKAILYENVELILVDEAKLLFTLKHIDGSVVHLHANKFLSNANKEWKIKKNKQEKFYKVITKIIDSALRENKTMTLAVRNVSRLKHYKRAVFS